MTRNATNEEKRELRVKMDESLYIEGEFATCTFVRVANSMFSLFT